MNPQPPDIVTTHFQMWKSKNPIANLKLSPRDERLSPRMSEVFGAASPGFTLIEVTLAIVLFSLAIVVMTGAFVNALTSLATIENEFTLQADLRFVRSHALKIADREEFEEGDTIETLSSGTATWSGSIESTGVSDLFFATLLIEMDPPDGGGAQVYQQNLYLLRPTWSDPVERSEIMAENADRLAQDRADKDWL